jgi:predicted dienelactone hydrolase
VFDVTRVTRRAAALAAAMTLVATGACAADDDVDPDGGAAGADSRGVAEPLGPFATGRRTTTLVDPGRGTDAVPGMLPERPDRTIEVEIVYPAAGEPGPPPAGEPVGSGSVVDAEPAEGAFPLVVFAHGWNGRADHFRGFAERWAREGYVVALPTFPLSREGIAVSDLADQPGDISFVIDQLEALGDGDPLAGHVDTGRVAVGGHSLGSATTFGVAYNSCCVDERIDATIPVAGGALPIDGGDYDDPPTTPMLLVHGARDAAVPVAAGDAMFDLFDAPTWYLRPTDADHVSVFGGDSGRLFSEAVLAFLDAQLRDDSDALDAMGDAVAASGVAEWRTKP